MLTYERTIYGLEPVAKGRPRFTRYGKTYTPKKTTVYEKAVRDGYAGFKFKGAIMLSVVFGMPIPKSTTKKMRQMMLDRIVFPAKKPDTDNLLKAVCDALNGVAFDDDSQIVIMRGSKVYAAEPFVTIKIAEVGEDGKTII